MSYIARDWALDAAPTADVEELAVLAKLAKHASDDGRGAWPSVPKIAVAVRCGEETVRRRLKAMLQRGLIVHGDQSLVQHFPGDKRPTVYDLLIPYAWYSDDHLARAQAGIGRFNAKIDNPATQRRELLTPENRPPLAPPPPKKQRADAGKPNPKRRPKTAAATTTPLQESPSPAAPLQESPPTTPLQDTPPSAGASARGVDGTSASPRATPLAEGQSSQSLTGPPETSHTSTAALPDGLPDDVAPEEEPRRDGGGGSAGAELLRSLRLTKPQSRTPLPVSERFVRDHQDAVTALLDTWPRDALIAHWEEECRGPRIMKPLGLLVTLIRDTTPRRPEPAAAAAPAEREWCGRDGSDGEDPCHPTSRTRTDAEGNAYRCDCNPRSIPEQREQPGSRPADTPVSQPSPSPSSSPSFAAPQHAHGSAHAGLLLDGIVRDAAS